MGQEIVYCSRCQSRLNGADFDRGDAVRISNYIYCTKCLTPDEKKLVENLRKPPDPQPPIRRSSTLKAASASSGAIPTVPKGPPAKRNPVVLIAAAAGALLLLILLIVVVAKSGGDKKQIVEVPSPTPAPPPQAAPLSWGLAGEFAALKTELQTPLSQKNFKFAQVVIDRAKGQHGDVRWVQSVAELEQNVLELARGRLKELKESAAKAAEKKATDEIREARDEVARWGPTFQSLLKEFDDAYGMALAATPTPPEPPKPVPVKPEDPPPPPPKPVDPGPVLVSDPQRSEAGRKYLPAWQKAMGHAARRDYDAAGIELKAAARDFKEDDVQKEIAADQKDLARMQALRADLFKEMAALPSWSDVVIDVAQEDGTRASIKGKLMQASARRLELRGEPRYVEIEDISPGSLVKVYAQKKAHCRPRTPGPWRPSARSTATKPLRPPWSRAAPNSSPPSSGTTARRCRAKRLPATSRPARANGPPGSSSTRRKWSSVPSRPGPPRWTSMTACWAHTVPPPS
jgi:hypothetical protein